MTTRSSLRRYTLPAGLALVAAGAADAQTALDRVAPTAVERRLPATVTPAPDQTRVRVDATDRSRAGGQPVMVGAITVRGGEVMAPADFADIIADFVGRTLAPADLGRLADRIGERARSRGLVFATAVIEPQRITAGVLVVRLDEGRIDAVRVEGTARAAVERALRPLINGRPVTLSQLERRLLIAGDVDGVSLRNPRLVREAGRGVLVVTATAAGLHAQASLANDGTRPIGPVQMRLDVDMRALLASDDAFALTYVAAPTQPDELQYARVRYVRRINASGTELSATASFSGSRPGAYLQRLAIDSRSWFVGANLLHPLLRRRQTSLWLQGELGLRHLAQRRQGDLVRRDRLAVLRAGLYGYTDLAGGRLRANATVSRGLGLLDATRGGDRLASRDDADGTFTNLVFWADWTRPIAGPFSVRFAAQSQLTFEPLLVTEELGLGGAGFLRAYDYSERSGDQGAAAIGELRYDWKRPLGLVKAAQLYAFVDGGRVTNLRSGYGGGSLASAGGGVRTTVSDRLFANVEVAQPLTGPRYDTGTRNPRISFRMGVSF